MNRVILIGRMTSNAELKMTSSGMAVASFSVAVDRGQDKGADFQRCIAFGKTAENLSKYMSKGSRIAIEGKVQTGSYEKRDGTKVYTTDVVADRVEFLDSKKTSENANQSRTEQSYEGFHAYNDDDEDVPF